MATKVAQRRLTREYKNIAANPPPYIEAHPSESNILEWHYAITGPEDTPYYGGQYWGVLIFPANYPFAPPQIRMHTPSGRFVSSTPLCLSISDFHPRSFNPAWEVSTILIGLLSFMTSDENTTGSLRASTAERENFAKQSRWWNSCVGSITVNRNSPLGRGDGGAKFQAQWPELHAANLEYFKKHNIDLATGKARPPVAAAGSGASSSSGGSSKGAAAASGSACAPAIAGASGASGAQAQAVVDAVVQGRGAGSSWLWNNKLYLFGGAMFVYVLLMRVIGGMSQKN